MYEIKKVAISSIKIDNRQRKDIGDLTELRNSFERDGQLNPILLDEDFNLIAGERRLRAAESLEWPQIDARIMPGLTQDQKSLIEYAENIGRKDFHWSEELQAKFDLYKYYCSLQKDFTYRDMAKILKVSLGGLSTDLEMAKAIRDIPALAEYPSKGKAREAYKQMHAKAEAIMAMESISPEERERLTEMMSNADNLSSLETTINGETQHLEAPAPEEKAQPLDRDSLTDEQRQLVDKHSRDVDPTLPNFIYEIGKFQNLIEKLPDKTVGFVEADPPYAINFNSVYGQAQDIESKAQDWTLEEFQQNMTILLSNLRRKLLDASWLLLWIGAEHEEWVQSLAVSLGYGIQPAGFWAKPGGGSNSPSTTMIHNYEKYLLLRWGDARFNTPSFRAVQECETPSRGERYHQWQKPLQLYNRFIEACGRPGAIFFSPFAGSGMSLISAMINQMMPVGCDVTNKYYYQFYAKMKEYCYGLQTTKEE